MTQPTSRRVRITKTIEFTSKDRTWSRLFRKMEEGDDPIRVAEEPYQFLKANKACVLAKGRSQGGGSSDEDDAPDPADAGPAATGAPAPE